MSNYYRLFCVILFVEIISGFPLDENISGNKYIAGNLQCFSSDAQLGIDQDTCPAPKTLNRRHTKYSEDGIKYKKGKLDSSTSSGDNFGVEEEIDAEDNHSGTSFFSKYTKSSSEKCDTEKNPDQKHAKKNSDIEYHKKHHKDHKEKNVITHSSNQYYGYKTHSTGENDLELNELSTVEESDQTKSESDFQSSEFNPVEDIQIQNIKSYSKERTKDYSQEINSAEFELNAQPQKTPEQNFNLEEMKASSNESLDLEEPISEESIDHPGPAEELHFDKLVPASNEGEVRKAETTSEGSTINIDDTTTNTDEIINTTTESSSSEEEITDSTIQTTNSQSDTSILITSTKENKIDLSTESSTPEIMTSSIFSTSVDS